MDSIATLSTMRESGGRDQNNQYIFVVEAECDMNVITRLHIIFTRRRISVLDFQSTQVNNGERQRILIILEETKENVLKLYNYMERQVDVMTVNLFESVI